MATFPGACSSYVRSIVDATPGVSDQHPFECQVKIRHLYSLSGLNRLVTPSSLRKHAISNTRKRPWVSIYYPCSFYWIRWFIIVVLLHNIFWYILLTTYQWQLCKSWQTQRQTKYHLRDVITKIIITGYQLDFLCENIILYSKFMATRFTLRYNNCSFHKIFKFRKHAPISSCTGAPRLPYRLLTLFILSRFDIVQIT